MLGVQFARLPKLTVAHLGTFWRQLGPDWPNVTQAPPLPPQFERFSGFATWAEMSVQLQFTQEVDVRLQIQNSDADRMIQVQNGWLYYNWLGHGGTGYPSYDNVKPEFDRVWNAFQQFISDDKLGELQPNQWEMTYVNHIPRGDLWNSPREWGGVVPLLLAPATPDLPIRLEAIAGEWHYEIPPQLGRLHVKLNPGLRKHEGDKQQELLVITLTARGPVGNEGKSKLGLDEGFRTGHGAIVTAFKTLSSEKAHDEWGIEK